MNWAAVFSLTWAALGQMPADPVFWLVVALVAFLYFRVEGLRKRAFGWTRPGAFLWETAWSTLWGFGGGVVASLVMVAAGVTLSATALLYLWPLAVALMLINARFLCFSYAAGLLALSRLLLGWPDLDVAQLMALVAVLHLAESLLILVAGHRGAVPVYVRSPANGAVVGGFALQKFWPLPVVALVALPGAMSGGLAMPAWWPLLGAAAAAYGLVPVVAGLGYGDLVLARTPRRKTRLQFAALFLYSLILLALAVLSAREPLLLYVAALFAPLGHEGVIHLGNRLESAAAPRYIRPAEGVGVLDVRPGSPFWRAGVRSGDVVTGAGGHAVGSRAELLAAVGRSGPLDIVYYRDRVFHRAVFFPGPVPGLVTVPEPGDEPFWETGGNRRGLRLGWLTWRRKGL